MLGIHSLTKTQGEITIQNFMLYIQYTDGDGIVHSITKIEENSLRK
jgi:hypothetical protein